MRGRLTVLVVVAGIAGAAPVGWAAPSVSPAPAPHAASGVMPAAEAAKCPAGQRWVPPGYAKHGKYRAGKCVPK